MKKLLLLTILLITSCQWGESASLPIFYFASVHAPPGTPAFKHGFEDGCATVLYSRGNMFYRAFHGYRYDPSMIGNAEYRFGHQRGYSVCFINVILAESGPRGSPDRMLFPHGYDETFNAGNVNNAWGGMFDGLSAPISPTPSNGFDAVFDLWSGGEGGGALSANPLWAGGSHGQFFGQ